MGEGEGQWTGADVTVVQTDTDAKDGQIKCPKCGSTDIQTNSRTGKLRCSFCRHEFEPQLLETEEDVSSLEGVRMGSGAQDRAADANDVITLKCESCGAEVVIDTASANQARCHWCRNMLSINHQVPNGAVPDAVLPFAVSKDDARAEIERFVGKRKFFAHPTFTREFTTRNICGVYFPYMIVDINAHDHLSGTGEVLIRKYSVKRGDSSETRYDADAYHVERDFDIAINDLTVEASVDKLNVSSSEKTTNIINSIMPFDTKNCVRYNANYLRGYTSEKRDVDVNNVRPLVATQAQDIARIAANETLARYDRGIAWAGEAFDIKGESWLAAYLPVWLYSYLQVKGNKKLLHYVAVNARTKETMGSVPIDMTKLWIVSIAIEFFGLILALFLGSSMVGWDKKERWLLLLPGVVFFAIMYMRYRNSGARHTYEKETERSLSNVLAADEFIEHREGLRNSRIEGANNTDLHGTGGGSILDGLL